VVDEVFGTAEVDEGTVNPTHLNLANRTRWLCEQTMRSNKRINEIVEQQKEMKAEIQANQAVIMEQLRSMAMQKADPYLY
jgi:hypothetical protein